MDENSWNKIVNEANRRARQDRRRWAVLIDDSPISGYRATIVPADHKARVVGKGRDLRIEKLK